MKSRTEILFYLNDRRMEVRGDQAFLTLAEFLRTEQGLVGTKIVCAEGDCGACTVVLGQSWKMQKGRYLFEAVNSCILPVWALDGCQVVTVEGLANGAELHPVQTAMVSHFGAQCGYCTPGMVCSMTAMLEEAQGRGLTKVSRPAAKTALTGNLCRCTGYEPILDAAESLEVASVSSLNERYSRPEIVGELKAVSARSVVLEADQATLHLPANLRDALELKARIPGLKVIAGATDVGVQINKAGARFPKVMSLQKLHDLSEIRESGDLIEIGAGVTLSRLEGFSRPVWPEFAAMLGIFASPQIKNRATLAGNVLNASPIADTTPFLLALDAELVLQNARGSRTVKLDSFYQGYKKMDLKEDELLTAILVPRPDPRDRIRLYKVSRRKDLDISAVTFAALIRLSGEKIESARVVLGGVGPVVSRISEAETRWTGARFERSLFEDTARAVPGWISPLSDVRGSKEYRTSLCQNLFLKFHAELSTELAGGGSP